MRWVVAARARLRRARAGARRRRDPPAGRVAVRGRRARPAHVRRGAAGPRRRGPPRGLAAGPPRQPGQSRRGAPDRLSASVRSRRADPRPPQLEVGSLRVDACNVVESVEVDSGAGLHQPFPFGLAAGRPGVQGAPEGRAAGVGSGSPPPPGRQLAGPGGPRSRRVRRHGRLPLRPVCQVGSQSSKSRSLNDHSHRRTAP